jgi:glutamine amidotransferase
MLTYSDDWVTVPTNSTLTIHKQTVMVHPIIDEYYNHNPYYSRSSKFGVEKGLITNEKGTPTPRAESPAPSNLPQRDAKRSSLTPKMHSNTSKVLALERHSIHPILGLTDQSNLRSEKGQLVDAQRGPPSIPPRDPCRTLERGNTKKKRRPVELESEPESPFPERITYGDPAKIAQYFPELTLT